MYRYIFFYVVLFFSFNVHSQYDSRKSELLKLLLKNNHDTVVIDAYNELAWPIYSYDLPDSSIYYAQKAITLSEKRGDFIRECIAHRRMGITYSNMGDLKRAVRHQEESFAIAEKINFDRGKYLALNNIGVAYLNNELLSRSLSYFLRSLVYIEGTNQYADLSKAYTNCGMIYRRSGDGQRAKEFFLKSKPFAELSKDSGLIISNLCHLSTTHRAAGSLDSTTFYLDLAQKLINPNTPNQVMYNYKLAEALSLSAHSDHNKALKIFYETKQYVTGLSDGITLTINIAEQYTFLREYNKALAFFQEAFNQSRDNKLYDNLEYVSLEMAKIREKLNDMKGYSSSIKLYIAYKDSNMQTNKAHELIGQQVEFDYQRKHVADSIRFEEKEKLKNVQLQMAAAKLDKEKTFRILILLVALLIMVLAGITLNRLLVTRRQKKIIENQKLIVETRNHEILDSINYARRLQEAILPQKSQIKQHLQLDILYLPKDVIGGDFYFFEKHNNLLFIAVCDCTGHGIPGALMSVVCHHAITKAIKEHNLTDPGKILDKTKEIVVKSLNAEKQNIKDGMDCSLCVLNLEDKSVKWSGANNPLWIIKNNTVTEIRPDKQPVALYEHPAPFTTHEIPYPQGSTLILLTDGYADQFGGPNAKKYKNKALKEFLVGCSAEEVDKQVNMLATNFKNWKGQLDQVDDVCIAVLKI